MKRKLPNWFLNAAFTMMLLSATSVSQAYNNLPSGGSNNETGTSSGPCPTWYEDSDGDGFGNVASTVVACAQPAGYVSNSTDCDDTDAAIWQSTNLFVDMDADGYYGSTVFNVCWGATVPAGHSTTTLGLDCNDSDPLVFNNADVWVDLDGDNYTHGPMADVCYGNVLPPGLATFSLGKDCDDTDPLLWLAVDLYIDADGDGYDVGTQKICYGPIVPAGYSLTTAGTDCDDTDAAINPGAAEIQGNHIDENCNGDADDAIGLYFTQLKASQCDGTLVHIYNACVAEVNTLGVTQYYYEITRTSDNQKQNYNTADSFFQLTDLASYEYETEYEVRCGMDVAGLWQGYGPSCYVTTPSLTTGAAAIVIPQCGTTLPERNSPIFVTGPSFVSSYEVFAYNTTTMLSQIITRTESWFSLKMMPLIYDYSTTYIISVRVATTGGYSAWSAPCNVSTPAAPGPKMANPALALSPVAYPNPFVDGFTLDLPNASKAGTQVKVYDMVGNLLEVRDIQPANIEAERLGINYPVGIYNVVLTQDGISESIRVIKR